MGPTWFFFMANNSYVECLFWISLYIWKYWKLLGQIRCPWPGWQKKPMWSGKETLFNLFWKEKLLLSLPRGKIRWDGLPSDTEETAAVIIFKKSDLELRYLSDTRFLSIVQTRVSYVVKTWALLRCSFNIWASGWWVDLMCGQNNH